ncbi:MAG TPA: dienelactone hydrolase family protein [Methylocystis sp.]|nr:dienelactone hydrolase family protein [Methylocystis sp.]
MNEIDTTADGLETQDFHLKSPAGETNAYLAKPIGRENLPVVLIAEEIFGLNDHIRDIARRFAHQGYFAIAPDFLTRHGGVAGVSDIATLRATVARIPDGETMDDFDAALDFAKHNGGDPTRAAIVGFCYGGRIVWLYAAHNPELRAAIPWYGRLESERTPAQPRWPLDVASDIKVPTLGLYGGADASIPLAQVEEMRRRLRAAGAPAEIVVYEGAPHAFFADYRDSYRREPAEDAWRRTLAFLRENGVR